MSEPRFDLTAGLAALGAVTGLTASITGRRKLAVFGSAAAAASAAMSPAGPAPITSTSQNAKAFS